MDFDVVVRKSWKVSCIIALIILGLALLLIGVGKVKEPNLSDPDAKLTEKDFNSYNGFDLLSNKAKSNIKGVEKDIKFSIGDMLSTDFIEHYKSVDNTAKYADVDINAAAGARTIQTGIVFLIILTPVLILFILGQLIYLWIVR